MSQNVPESKNEQILEDFLEVTGKNSGGEGNPSHRPSSPAKFAELYPHQREWGRDPFIKVFNL